MPTDRGRYLGNRVTPCISCDTGERKSIGGILLALALARSVEAWQANGTHFRFLIIKYGPPSPREFGRFHLKLDQAQPEFTRRGGWGVRSNGLSCGAFIFGEMQN